MLSSLSNQAIFSLKYFYLKKHRKTRTFIVTSMMRENSIMAFHHVFLITFYAVTLQALLKNLKDFDFFKATLYMYFENFIEECDFVELSTQVKHLKLYILYDD